jgi:hypothetical protein
MKKHTNHFSTFLTLYVALLVGLLTSHAPPTNASQGTLEYCQKISDKIHYYTSLRKMGGSPKTMENWKQQRKNYKEKFINRNCKKFKDKLRS